MKRTPLFVLMVAATIFASGEQGFAADGGSISKLWPFGGRQSTSKKRKAKSRQVSWPNVSMKPPRLGPVTKRKEKASPSALNRTSSGVRRVWTKSKDMLTPNTKRSRTGTTRRRWTLPSWLGGKKERRAPKTVNDFLRQRRPYP